MLAAASSPRYDARLLISATSAEWDAVSNDPRRPFFPRVTQATLPPGSVFKSLTAIAGIEAGVINPAERFDCAGYLERPDRERCAIYRHFGVGHGPVTLAEALAQSCNVYFFDVAQKLGPMPIVTWAERFGCGVATGCDLAGEQAGHVPHPHRRGPGDAKWYPGTTRQLAIGQGELTVTPLQVVRMTAAIANDGWLVTPHFVRDIPPAVEEDGSESASESIQLAGLSETSPGTTPKPQRIEGLTPGTLAEIRRGMQQAVENPRDRARSVAQRRANCRQDGDG